MSDTRDIVLDILMDIEVNNTFSNIALNKALSKNQFTEKNQRAFITRLSEGVTETRLTLDYIINQFSKVKTNKQKPKIRCIIRMGAYQLLFMDSVPDSAACNEAVKLAKKHGFAGLSGFVNGVLRSIAKNKDNITYPDKNKEPVEYLSVKYSVTPWLAKKLITDYPDKYEDILKGSFEERKTSIRVNLCKISRDELEKLLINDGIQTEHGHYSEKALLISGYDFIKKIPGYKQGCFTVQDESSMCAVEAAFGCFGDKITGSFKALDVCAAPGGKTTAALEIMNGRGKVYSMDISEDKLSLIEENVERLGFDNADISCYDASKPLRKEDIYGFEVDASKAVEFDLVIADVPCSGLGIIGRKNDIKYHVNENRLKELDILQDEIMKNASGYVKKNGIFLYCTCTVNPDENNKKTAGFLKNNKDFQLVSERQFVQGIDKCDGFYYAVMKRN